MATDIEEMLSYFKDEIKSSEYKWYFYNDTANGFDWKTREGETLEDVIRENTEYGEDAIVDIMGEDPEANGWEDIKGDNTYNWGYLGPQDANFHLWHNKKEGKYMLEIAVHQGGDIRGSYGESHYVEVKDEDEYAEKIFDIVGGENQIYIEFKDGTIASFYGTQDSDVNSFETSQESDDTGTAKELTDLLETFNNSSDVDNFAIELAEAKGGEKAQEAEEEKEAGAEQAQQAPVENDLEQETPPEEETK